MKFFARVVTACLLFPAIPPAMANEQGAMHFPGSARFEPVDSDKDGYFEALEVEVDADLLNAGMYTVSGLLEDANGTLVANRPAIDMALFSKADVSGLAGHHTIRLRFSGEQIWLSGTDGPYILKLQALGSTGTAEGQIETPAYERRLFGERRVRLETLTVTPVDADHSGKFEALRLDAQGTVLKGGTYWMVATLVGHGDDVGVTTQSVTLEPGQTTITAIITAERIIRSGISGPYEAVLKLDDQGSAIASAHVDTQAFEATQFEVKP